ncbi:hypothetical protein [Burkholderia sp. lig30]|jgi:hypothetical protein|uniref:hypothetical protein n=1 Tax=Burkholderia sp. lig30 TaxID=1192124 RepID=UPI000572272C|nr:hypothetical protein [Burkholderia sp. lig30]
MQDWTAHDLDAAIETLKKLLPDQPAKTSTIVPRVQQSIDVLTEWSSHIRSPAPEDIEGVRDIVLKALPTFVYYSSYGNLDSEIYLPHVVQNLERKDLGAKEAAKARMGTALRPVRAVRQLRLDSLTVAGIRTPAPGAN